MYIVRIDDDSKDIDTYSLETDWTQWTKAYNLKNINDTRYTFGGAFLTG